MTEIFSSRISEQEGGEEHQGKNPFSVSLFRGGKLIKCMYFSKGQNTFLTSDIESGLLQQ